LARPLRSAIIRAACRLVCRRQRRKRAHRGMSNAVELQRILEGQSVLLRADRLIE
jgi:hypothetical protein